MGQKVTTELHLRDKENTIKYNFYIFMLMLIGAPWTNSQN